MIVDLISNYIDTYIIYTSVQCKRLTSRKMHNTISHDTQKHERNSTAGLLIQPAQRKNKYSIGAARIPPPAGPRRQQQRRRDPTRVWRRVLEEQQRNVALVTELHQVGHLDGVPSRHRAVVGHHAHQPADGDRGTQGGVSGDRWVEMVSWRRTQDGYHRRTDRGRSRRRQIDGNDQAERIP